MVVAEQAVVQARLAVLGLILALGLVVLATTARVSGGHAPRAEPVPITHHAPTERLVLVFIDSLRREVATDPGLMPNLGKLAREGASFDVEPCRDQLTYLCIRAALTGRDDSSLLAVRDNFRPNHEGPPDTILTEVARRHRISVIGSNDFHPYRQYLFAEHSLEKQDETVEHVLPLFNAELQRGTEVIVVALASGDMNAHAHGVGSPAYNAAFARLDGIVGAITGAMGSSTNLVVFGDHGHDQLGRHLPGTTAHTWAVYRGSAFRPSVTSPLSITDHHALLALLLGVPIQATYRGPAISGLLDPIWVNKMLRGTLPRVNAPRPTGRDPSLWHWGIAAAVAVTSWLFMVRLARKRFDNSGIPSSFLRVAAAATVLASAAIGSNYDAVRGLLHDHGDSPWRALSLLLLPGTGVIIAWSLARSQAKPIAGVVQPIERRSSRSSQLNTWATSTLLVTFLLMLPTAYYYGARRTVLLAALLSLSVWLCARKSVRLPRHIRDFGPWLALTFVASVLISLYSVRQLGPETGAAAAFALDARVYTQHPCLTLAIAKLVIFWVLIAPDADRRPLDVAGAAALLSASTLVEMADTHLPKEAYLCLFVAALVGVLVLRRRAMCSLFAGGLLLLDHLYQRQPSQLAAIEMILAATATALLLWRTAHTGKTAKAWLTALTLVLAAYLMFWPTVGFHLTGIDFTFMFQWVKATQYEEAWHLIAAGFLLKLAIPLILLMAIARDAIRRNAANGLVLCLWFSKVALLSTLIVFYAMRHSMASQQATAVLAELILLLFGAVCIIIALPGTQLRPRGATRWGLAVFRHDPRELALGESR